MKIAVLGGDKRMLFAAKAFLSEGYEVAAAGFDSLFSLCEIKVMTVYDAALWCDIAVLPVKPTKDNYLNTPFSKDKISIADLVKELNNKPIFSGFVKDLPKYDGSIYDYSVREDFTCKNAELTAEGALSVVLSEYEGSVFGADILVLGFGRIGKILSSYLKAMGADVTVAARRLSDRSLANIYGCKSVDFSSVPYCDYDIIFNTVPSLVVTKDDVYAMRDDVFIIDLASSPGGVDFSAAKERELSCIHALSLPGITAPFAAGKIIKDTILNIIKEENGGKESCGLCDDRLILHS